MAKRQIKPKRPERLEHLIPHVEDDKPDEGKRIVVMLSPELAERVEVQMNIQDRDALISTMLTEYLDEQDEQAERERRLEKRREALSNAARRLGDAFLP